MRPSQSLSLPSLHISNVSSASTRLLHSCTVAPLAFLLKIAIRNPTSIALPSGPLTLANHQLAAGTTLQLPIAETVPGMRSSTAMTVGLKAATAGSGVGGVRAVALNMCTYTLKREGRGKKQYMHMSFVARTMTIFIRLISSGIQANPSSYYIAGCS